uniref:Uncharacterized protein n=1 Tax=Nelumbo nucifera TaxID=4432 RepID=A0A822Z265_NELNU|nr:TPA_asm: hypothetical protein HUJ06_007727 [Nelumbo nucifera]
MAVHTVLADFRTLHAHLPSCSVSFVPRNANCAAHSVVKQGLSLNYLHLVSGS